MNATAVNKRNAIYILIVTNTYSARIEYASCQRLTQTNKNVLIFTKSKDITNRGCPCLDYETELIY